MFAPSTQYPVPSTQCSLYEIQECLRAGKQLRSFNLALLGNMKGKRAIWLAVLWSNSNSLWWNWNYTAVSALGSMVTGISNAGTPRGPHKQKLPMLPRLQQRPPMHTIRQNMPETQGMPQQKPPVMHSNLFSGLCQARSEATNQIAQACIVSVIGSDREHRTISVNLSHRTTRLDIDYWSIVNKTKSPSHCFLSYNKFIWFFVSWATG